MDDELTRYGTKGSPAAACDSTSAHWDALVSSRKTGQQRLAALLQLGPCCPCNVLGDPPRETQLMVGGVHDSCHLLLGQVASDYLYTKPGQ